MRPWIHRLKGYLTGALTIDNSFKYSLICFITAFIHLIITVTFCLLDVAPIFYYNIGATIFYLYMAFQLVKQEKYIEIFIGSLIEIIFHSVVVTILLGWQWGFMNYLISLLPVAFYLSLTLPQIHMHIITPIIIGISVCAVFVATRIGGLYIKPVYTDISSDLFINTVYCLNSATGFGAVLFFSILFSIEIRQMQRKLMKENETLDVIASHDPLTGLLNRRSMLQHLNKVMDTAQSKNLPFSLIMADIDDFKKVNDTYGHDTGDQVLIHVAEVIKKELNNSGSVCRWGGEEILFLIDDTQEAATRIAEDIRRILESSPFTTHDGVSVSVTMTFGVTGYQPGLSIDRLIKITDENLYTGKRNGKNQVVS